jgi:hypothetical protein
MEDYYGIRNGHEEDPRLPWLKELVDWRGTLGALCPNQQI